MPDSPFLTVEEVAELLRVPVSCVYAWTSRIGPTAIPRYRAGKRLVFREREVLDWFLDTRRVGLGSAPRARRARAGRGVKRRAALAASVLQTAPRSSPPRMGGLASERTAAP